MHKGSEMDNEEQSITDIAAQAWDRTFDLLIAKRAERKTLWVRTPCALPQSGEHLQRLCVGNARAVRDFILDERKKNPLPESSEPYYWLKLVMEYVLSLRGFKDSLASLDKRIARSWDGELGRLYFDLCWCGYQIITIRLAIDEHESSDGFHSYGVNAQVLAAWRITAESGQSALERFEVALDQYRYLLSFALTSFNGGRTWARLSRSAEEVLSPTILAPGRRSRADFDDAVLNVVTDGAAGWIDSRQVLLGLHFLDDNFLKSVDSLAEKLARDLDTLGSRELVVISELVELIDDDDEIRNRRVPRSKKTIEKRRDGEREYWLENGLMVEVGEGKGNGARYLYNFAKVKRRLLELRADKVSK